MKCIQIPRLLSALLAQAHSKKPISFNSHKPYKLKSLAKRVNEKLCPQFYGPFKCWIELE